MAVGSRLISLFTLSSVAVLICSLQATPVAALSVEGVSARGLHNRGHDALAKRKRSTKKNKRCKPKPAPASSSSEAASSTPAPSSSKASSSPAPSSSSSSSSGNDNSNKGGNTLIGGSSKAGLGWPNGEADLGKWKGISAIYTWAPACPSNAKDLGITCCPMLWGWNQVGQFQSEVSGSSPECVMGPNEPEISGQSNMDAGSGVAIWNQYIRPLKSKGTTLISPAPTSDPAGKKWLQDFFSICGGDCDVDIVALHWYDVSGDALIAYLEDMHSTFNKPLWLTEFACQNFNGGAQCSEGDVWGFQAKVTGFMESTDYVLKYMPFGAMHDMQGVNGLNQLMDGSGGPNALAKAYFGL